MKLNIQSVQLTAHTLQLVVDPEAGLIESTLGPKAVYETIRPANKLQVFLVMIAQAIHVRLESRL